MTFWNQQDKFIEELDRIYHKRMFYRCMQYVHYDRCCVSIAESCVQDVLLVAYEKYDKLKNHPNIVGWLYQACDYRMIKYVTSMRKVWDHETSLEGMSEHGLIPGRDEPIQRWHEVDDSATTVESMMMELSASDKELLCMHHLEGKSLNEIAAKRNTTEASVKVMLYRAREKANKILKKHCNLVFFC